MSRPPPHTFFAACPPGAEPVLHREVRDLRLARAEAQVGGVRFEGPPWEGWRAVLHLRTATRVYRVLARFGAETATDLHRGAAAVEWDSVLTPDQTFAVRAKVSDSRHRHSGFVALKVKDAVADWFREHHRTRPSVDPDHPDVSLFAYVRGDRCTLSVDLAGRSLHRRGYRVAAPEAPLSESLAAAAVGFSGWDFQSPFLDPLCGSGTLLAEAGLWAAGVAPGLLRDDFAFQRFPGFHTERWEELREAAHRAVRIPRKVILRGGDADPQTVAAARQNLEAAGLGGWVEVEHADVRDFRPTPGWGATVITNPPFGVRLADEETLVPFYEELGRLFKERCRGFRVHLFLASARLARAFRLKPDRYWPLRHGGLSCRLARYPIR